MLTLLLKQHLYIDPKFAVFLRARGEVGSLLVWMLSLELVWLATVIGMMIIMTVMIKVIMTVTCQEDCVYRVTDPVILGSLSLGC